MGGSGPSRPAMASAPWTPPQPTVTTSRSSTGMPASIRAAEHAHSPAMTTTPTSQNNKAYNLAQAALLRFVERIAPNYEARGRWPMSPRSAVIGPAARTSADGRTRAYEAYPATPATTSAHRGRIHVSASSPRRRGQDVQRTVRAASSRPRAHRARFSPRQAARSGNPSASLDATPQVSSGAAQAQAVTGTHERTVLLGTSITGGGQLAVSRAWSRLLPGSPGP